MDVDYLSTREPFRDLSKAGRQASAPMLRRCTFPHGEVVFEQGDPPGDLFMIDDGFAQAVVHIEGRDLVLGTLGPGDFFGGMGFFQGRPRSCAIRAASEALHLTSLPRQMIAVLEEVDPKGLTAVYRQCFMVTADRLRSSNEALTRYFRARLEDEERLQREKELRYLLVHDLRSPLAICEAGIGQLLERQSRYGSLTDKQVRVLKRSRRSALFLRRLVTEILEVGRTETGEVEHRPATIRGILMDAIPETLGGVSGPSLDDIDDPSNFQELKRRLAEQDFFVEAEPSVLDTPLWVDRWFLVHVVMNLVGNALKHAPGWVRVRVRRDGDRARFEVTDRGPGIPDAYRKTIFDFDSQSRAKSEGVHRGFGLGLAGAARLVKALDGAIWAEPGDDGEGTSMVFEVPWLSG